MLQEIALSAHHSPSKWSKLLKQVTVWVDAITAGFGNPATSTVKLGDDISNGTADYGSLDEAEGNDYVEGVVEHTRQNAASRILQHMAITRLDGNCLFATNGGLVGIATKNVLEGDEVYLVAGMRLPMIVRRVADSHRLIGAAFVHDTMLGEMWDDDESALEELKLV